MFALLIPSIIVAAAGLLLLVEFIDYVRARRESATVRVRAIFHEDGFDARFVVGLLVFNFIFGGVVTWVTWYLMDIETPDVHWWITVAITVVGSIAMGLFDYVVSRRIRWFMYPAA